MCARLCSSFLCGLVLLLYCLQYIRAWGDMITIITYSMIYVTTVLLYSQLELRANRTAGISASAQGSILMPRMGHGAPIIACTRISRRSYLRSSAVTSHPSISTSKEHHGHSPRLPLLCVVCSQNVLTVLPQSDTVIVTAGNNNVFRLYRTYSNSLVRLQSICLSVCPYDPLRRCIHNSLNSSKILRLGIFGHSMGGHGALTIALKNPNTYKYVTLVFFEHDGCSCHDPGILLMINDCISFCVYG